MRKTPTLLVLAAAAAFGGFAATAIREGVEQPAHAEAMPVGAEIVVSGRMEWFNGRPTMVHPDHIASAEEAEALPLIEPVYPLTAGLSPKTLRRAIGQALARVPELPEWQDGEIIRRQTFPAFDLALKRIHGERVEDESVVFDAALIRRASVAAPALSHRAR